MSVTIRHRPHQNGWSSAHGAVRQFHEAVSESVSDTVSGLERVSVVIASEQEGEESCEIDYVQGPPAVVRLHSCHFGEVTVTDEDLFGALCKLRVHLEKDGYLLLCNAARKDAYPSRMSRQMAGGRKVYLLKPGLQGRREDLVDVFDAAPLDRVGSVAEQRLMFEFWLRSLK